MERSVLVRTFCHVCDGEQDHDLRAAPPGTYLGDGVVWWCLGCGRQDAMHESWGIRVEHAAPYRQASA